MKIFELGPTDSRAEAALYVANSTGRMQVICNPQSTLHLRNTIAAYWFRVRLVAEQVGMNPTEFEEQIVRPMLFGHIEREDGSRGKLGSIKEHGPFGIQMAINSFYCFNDIFPGIKFEQENDNVTR